MRSRPTPVLDTSLVMSAQMMIEIAPDRGNVAAARRFVASNLEIATPDQPELIEDLELATSELVTNAIEHGTDEPVTVTVDVRGGEVAVSVTSRGHSSAMAPVDAWRLPSADAVFGRGLPIVRALADRVDLSTRGDIVVVTVFRSTRQR